MKEQMPSNAYEAYKQRKSWARGEAERLGVELSEGEEFFLVPIYNESGEEIRVEHIPTGRNMDIVDENGKSVFDKAVSPEKVVEAIQKYPDLPLSQALKNLRADGKKKGGE